MQGKRRESLDLYKNVVASGQRAWVRDYATMRIVGLCDEMGELWIAYRGYLQLAAEHPRLCERILPRRIPRKDSKVCRDILVDIEAASSQPQSANLAAARERMRRAVLRLPPSDPVAKSPAVPAPGKPGPVEAPPAANLRPPADSPLSPRLAAVRDALLTGDLDAATRRLEECRALARPRDESALLLLDAQLAWARGDVRGAGLRAMQIVAGYPNSPEVAEALFVTGQTHEKLNRPEKALELYQRSAADARASEDLKRRARERINALAPATASGTPPAGGTP
jgi:tetratricopeptide (TPR) repeat protein